MPTTTRTIEARNGIGFTENVKDLLATSAYFDSEGCQPPPIDLLSCRRQDSREPSLAVLVIGCSQEA
jgi:hypothetical protein